MAIKFELLRPDDLLNLHVEAENLRLDTTSPKNPVLVPENPNQDSFLIVTFPPQTVIEEAFFESSPSQPVDPDEANAPYNQDPPPGPALSVPVEARIGGTSRLVFRFPAGSNPVIPFNIESLLDWENLELAVSALADIPAEPTFEERQDAPAIAKPDRLETAIELPYRLILSPNHNVAWQHALKPKTHQGVTELWHTRLALRGAEGEPVELSRFNRAALRAIWSPDYNPDKFHGDDPPVFGEPDADWGVLTPMTPSDRHEIVVLTSAFHGYVRDKDDFRSYQPSPVYAEQFILSPLGGWLKSRGDWDPPAPFHPFYVVFGLPTQPWDLYIQDLSNLPIFGGVQPGPPRQALPGGGFNAAPKAPAGAAKGGAKSSALIGGSPGAFLPAQDLVGGVLWPQLWGETGDLLNMSSWTHIATLGRDHYVRIVYEGHLFPFNQRASLIKITERKIRDVKGADGKITPLAYLVQRMFIIVRRPRRDYTTPDVVSKLDYDGRELPFNAVRLTTLVTPDIADPSGPSQIPGTISFWVRLGSGSGPADDLKFNAVGEDLAGEQIDFTASLIFIPFGEAQRAKVFQAYIDADGGEERACIVPGQKITFAPPSPGGASENTSLTTTHLYFGSQEAPVNKEFGGFLPSLFKARVKLPAVEALLGTSAETQIDYAPKYLSADPANTSGLFARVVEDVSAGQVKAAKLLSEFSADKAGGFATPNLSISGITSQFGPLAGELDKIAADDFQPADFFNDVKDDALLFGTFSLIDLLVPLTMGAGAPKVQITKEPVPANPNAIKLVTTLDWEPDITDAGFDVGIVTFHPNRPDENGDQAKLEVHGRIEKVVEIPPSGAPDPGYAVMEGSLTDFRIELLHVVEVLFKQFAFKSESGEKMDVTVELDPEAPVKFKDDLSFVEELRKNIPPDLFGDGPSLDISLTGIKAGFSIGLPPVSVGVFSLRDVALAASIELPFLDGKPLFDFSFSSREHPFNLTVTIFGGGGFFHLQIDTLGVKMLEAALEFGASASIDLGVASGGVYIMAGIYFSIERREVDGVETDVATLGGYLRMGGELSILGLISVSLEFYLIFAYEVQKNAAYGRATLTVKVEVLFISKSVEITVEKRFGGSGGDPFFLETFDTPAVWDEYAGAFA